MPSWNEKTWLMVILLSGVSAMALSWWLQVSPARTQLHQLHQDHHTLLKNIGARQHQFLDLRAQNTAITDLSSDFTPAFSHSFSTSYLRWALLSGCPISGAASLVWPLTGRRFSRFCVS